MNSWFIPFRAEKCDNFPQVLSFDCFIRVSLTDRIEKLHRSIQCFLFYQIEFDYLWETVNSE